MKIQGVLLGWGKNENGYRWIDLEGLRLDCGKNGVPDSALEALVGREVEVHVVVDFRQKKDGGWFTRRRVLTVLPK